MQSPELQPHAYPSKPSVRLRSLSMPSKRKTAIVTKPDQVDADSKEPAWDSAERTLMLYLLMLIRWLPKQAKHLSLFVKRGYILDRNLKIVCIDQAHYDYIKAAATPECSWQSPCIITSTGAIGSSSSASSTSSTGVATAAATLAGPATPSAPTTLGTPTGAAPSDAIFSAKALEQFDDELMHFITSTIDDEDTVDELEDECGNSGRALLKLLFDRANKISTASGTNIE